MPDFVSYVPIIIIVIGVAWAIRKLGTTRGVKSQLLTKAEAMNRQVS